MANYSSILSIFFLTILCHFTSHIAAYNVAQFGARGDGRTDSTLSFLRAWKSACSSARPATVYVPRGTYLVKSASFLGPCRSRITFQIDGKLVAPGNYWAFGNSGFWMRFHRVSRLTIRGGTIDARGSGFWSCRKKGQNCPAGARSILLSWCNDVVVNGLKSYNSQIMHMSIDNCRNVKMQNMQITAPSGSPNTDGIHVESTIGLSIEGCTIKTGDDCISLGPGSMNVHISKIACGPGHGISIGSLGQTHNEAGVQNVTVTSSVFTKTQNGVRVKSWARPSGGYARNLHFRNLIMRNVAYPIIIDQKYCPNNVCPRQSSGVKVSHVTYRNIKGTSATQAAVKFDCSSSNPCKGITLHDIKLTSPSRNRPTVAYCRNAIGTHKGSVFPKSCL